jgi:hypothetical protein
MGIFRRPDLVAFRRRGQDLTHATDPPARSTCRIPRGAGSWLATRPLFGAGTRLRRDVACSPTRRHTWPGWTTEAMDDRGRGSPITLPDGSSAPRIRSIRRWLCDGELCGTSVFAGNLARPPCSARPARPERRREDHPAPAVSPGQKRRLAVAVAFCRPPRPGASRRADRRLGRRGPSCPVAGGPPLPRWRRHRCAHQRLPGGGRALPNWSWPSTWAGQGCLPGPTAAHCPLAR